MDELTCPQCGTTFPNQAPYRRTGRNVGDTVTCPNCGTSGNPRFFMKRQDSPGVGTQLTNFTPSPAQLAMQQMSQFAAKLDSKKLYKFADKIDRLIFDPD